MKPESNSNNIVNNEANNNQQLQPNSIKSAQRKSTVHDLAHVVSEDCLKLINECHVLASKYHQALTIIGCAEEDTIQFRDEMKTLRNQLYSLMKAGLDKLIPQFDQISTKETEIASKIQQIVTSLEYLKLEFGRNTYLLDRYFVEPMQNRTADASTGGKTTNKKPENIYSTEINQIKKDMKEMDDRIVLLSQKYFTGIPDIIEEIKLTSKPSNKTSVSSSNSRCRIFSKLKLICCVCSPRYL